MTALLFPHCRAIAFLIVTLLLVNAAGADTEMWRWTDEKGTPNYTDNYSNIPAEHRDSAEKIELSREDGVDQSRPAAGPSAPDADAVAEERGLDAGASEEGEEPKESAAWKRELRRALEGEGGFDPGNREQLDALLTGTFVELGIKEEQAKGLAANYIDYGIPLAIFTGIALLIFVGLFIHSLVTRNYVWSLVLIAFFLGSGVLMSMLTGPGFIATAYSAWWAALLMGLTSWGAPLIYDILRVGEERLWLKVTLASLLLVPIGLQTFMVATA